MPLTDHYGRSIRYLRISVTDLCNLRCRYCMPAEGVPKLKHADVLTFEQLHRIARTAVDLGVDKIRVTGGEPLVRRNVVEFLEDLSNIAGLKELVLTTNGLLLREFAPSLRRAGVKRLNVSLDSLRPEVFAAMTRGGQLRQALDGIDAAEKAGFPPVKLNTVVVRGMNDDELANFAALTLNSPRQVRFIEYMPTNTAPDWKTAFVSAEEILRRIRAVYPLEEIPRERASSPARLYRIPGGAGTIGVISPISGHFCAACDRVRVTAFGVLRGCLFDGVGVDLKPYLQEDYSLLRTAMEQVFCTKPERHHLLDMKTPGTGFAMSQIGG